MSAFIQSVQALVFVLASAAFAHFGFVLKDTPCPKTQQAVRRIAVAELAPPAAAILRAAPCPLTRRLDRA